MANPKILVDLARRGFLGLKKLQLDEAPTTNLPAVIPDKLPTEILTDIAPPETAASKSVLDTAVDAIMNRDFSRRNFLKGSARAGQAATVMGKIPRILGVLDKLPKPPAPHTVNPAPAFSKALSAITKNYYVSNPKYKEGINDARPWGLGHVKPDGWVPQDVQAETSADTMELISQFQHQRNPKELAKLEKASKEQEKKLPRLFNDFDNNSNEYWDSYRKGTNLHDVEKWDVIKKIEKKYKVDFYDTVHETEYPEWEAWQAKVEKEKGRHQQLKDEGVIEDPHSLEQNLLNIEKTSDAYRESAMLSRRVWYDGEFGFDSVQWWEDSWMIPPEQSLPMYEDYIKFLKKSKSPKAKAELNRFVDDVIDLRDDREWLDEEYDGNHEELLRATLDRIEKLIK
jgi:hypothetical protein